MYFWSILKKRFQLQIWRTCAKYRFAYPKDAFVFRGYTWFEGSYYTQFPEIAVLQLETPILMPVSNHHCNITSDDLPGEKCVQMYPDEAIKAMDKATYYSYEVYMKMVNDAIAWVQAEYCPYAILLKNKKTLGGLVKAWPQTAKFENDWFKEDQAQLAKASGSIPGACSMMTEAAIKNKIATHNKKPRSKK